MTRTNGISQPSRCSPTGRALAPSLFARARSGVASRRLDGRLRGRLRGKLRRAPLPAFAFPLLLALALPWSLLAATAPATAAAPAPAPGSASTTLPSSGSASAPVPVSSAVASAPAPSPTPARFGSLQPGVPPLPDASFSIIRVFGALVFVLGLFLAGVWLLKNWQRLSVQRGRSAHLHVIEAKALGGKHVLYVLGYHDQRLLIAASPSGVSLVSHLPAAEAAEPAAGAAGALPLASANFVEALQQAVQGKA